jgi:hypothetical protein
MILIERLNGTALVASEFAWDRATEECVNRLGPRSSKEFAPTICFVYC